MGKIFISYARADDGPFVKQLYQDLIERGFEIWWDRKAMESRGLTFLQEIRDAIEGSDRLIAVIGPNAVKSEYVKVEWEHALLFSKGVIPILRKGFELPGKNDYDIVPPELSKFDCPDFRKERSYQDALEELVRKLKTPVPSLGEFHTEVPSLPAHFLPRHDELVLLGNAVLADIKRPEVVNSARQKTVIVGMGGMGKSVAVLQDSKYTISVSSDNTLKVWDMESGTVLKTLEGYTRWVTAVAALQDGKCAISATQDDTIKIWNIESGNVLVSFDGDSTPFCCAVSLDGKTIVAGEDSGRVHFLRLEGVD